MITKNSFIQIILASSILLETVFFILYRNNLPSSAINLALIIGAVAITYIMSSIGFNAYRNRNPAGIHVDKKIYTRRMHTGELNYFEVTIHNKTPNSLPAVKAVDIFPASFKLVEGSSTCSTSIDAHGKVTYSYVLMANERGGYTFGPTEIYLSDALGYVMDRYEIDTRSKIIVYPPLNRYVGKRIKKPSEHLAAGTKTSKRKGCGFDYVGSRRFIVGDELKMVDWKYFARTNQPGTKEFLIERNIDIMMVIDCSDTMNCSDGKVTLLDACADGCSYLVRQFFKQGDKVGVMTCTSVGMTFRTPVSGRVESQKVLGEIASIEARRGDADLEKCLKYAMNRITNKTLFFIFTDKRDASAVSRINQQIRCSGHDALFIIPYVDCRRCASILSPQETARHSPGYVHAVLEMFYQEEQTELKRFVHELASRGIKAIPASTDRMIETIDKRMSLQTRIGAGGGIQ